MSSSSSRQDGGDTFHPAPLAYQTHRPGGKYMEQALADCNEQKPTGHGPRHSRGNPALRPWVDSGVLFMFVYYTSHSGCHKSWQPRNTKRPKTVSLLSMAKGPGGAWQDRVSSHHQPSCKQTHTHIHNHTHTQTPLVHLALRSSQHWGVRMDPDCCPGWLERGGALHAPSQ